MKAQKDLKEEYKQKKTKMGVFQIKNSVNGKILVGSGLNLDAIWNRNRMELNFGSHRNAALQADWKEFGENKFDFEILSEIQEKEGETINYNQEVKKLEEMFLEELMPFGDKGYHLPKKP